MSYEVVCDAALEAVGQGCFYSARISQSGAQPFVFVYDCGSLSSTAKLESEIKEFARSIGHARLNMLMVSHLDADHVNGVHALLKATGGVRDVFLPYFSPLERLLYALRFPAQAEEYYSLLRDPVAHLRELGAERVILVRGNDGDGPAEGDTNEANQPPPEPGREHRLKLTLDKRAGNAGALYQKELGGADLPGDVVAVSDASVVLLGGIWKFRFFQKEGLRTVLDAVWHKDVAALKAANANDRKRCEAFVDEVKKVVPSLRVADLLTAIQTEASRKALRKAYANIAKVHNEVSLTVWHGPIVYRGSNTASRANGSRAVSWDPFHCARRVFFEPHVYGGSMLTGDICLKAALRPKFLSHFRSEIDHTAFFQLPHHGSHHNWEAHDDLLSAEPSMMVSAGISNNYGHPHFDVVEHLVLDRGLTVFMSNQRQAFRYRVKVSIV